MAQTAAAPTRQHSNSYNIFILVLTIISLVIMVVMLLPLSDATIGLLQVYDNLICVIFLADFLLNLRAAEKKSDYFIKDRGWLDLLGSVPSLGLTFKYSGILRLARLSRLARIARLMRGQARADLVQDVVQNRSRYTTFITILLTIIVMATASVLVLQFESQSPDASITTAGDALWYSLVTITTVGYGDFYPITTAGRATAFFIMVAGVGIIGVLASLMSSMLLGPSDAPGEEAVEAAADPAIERELAALRKEVAVLRRLLEGMAAGGDRQ